MVNEHLYMEVNAKYFANETFLYWLILAGRLRGEGLEAIGINKEVHMSSGKCIHCFSDSSKRSLVVANSLVVSEMEEAREKMYLRKCAEKDHVLCPSVVFLLFSM